MDLPEINKRIRAIESAFEQLKGQYALLIELKEAAEKKPSLVSEAK